MGKNSNNTNCNYSVVINEVACVAGGIRGEEDFTLPQNPLKIWKISDTIWKICQNLNAPQTVNESKMNPSLQTTYTCFLT
jgi:hypothetical protein